MKRICVMSIFLAVIAAALCVCACGGGGRGLDTSVLFPDGERVFAFSPEEFVEVYNDRYRADNGEDHLRPLSGWTVFDDLDCPFSEKESLYFRFSPDERILTAPTISVYTTADGGHVRGITVDFDDHGYSGYEYELYTEQCFYTVKALLPGLSDSDTERLCSELVDYAYEHFTAERLSPDTIPGLLYYTDEVGFYSHFAEGSFVRLCAVPVTGEYIAGLAEKGAETRRLILS